MNLRLGNILVRFFLQGLNETECVLEESFFELWGFDFRFLAVTIGLIGGKTLVKGFLLLSEETPPKQFVLSLIVSKYRFEVYDQFVQDIDGQC